MISISLTLTLLTLKYQFFCIWKYCYVCGKQFWCNILAVNSMFAISVCFETLNNAENRS